MDYQEYCEETNELIKQKYALYEIASRKYLEGDFVGQQAVYAAIDKVQGELDALENPLDQDEKGSLDLNFDS